MWSCNNNLATTVAQGYQSTGPALFGAIQTFLAAQCLLAPDVYHEPGEQTLQEIADTTYDFIVVGGGTAGAVVASRLAEDWNVLVLEAGGNPTLGTEIPALFINNYGTNEDWNFRTTSQRNACLNYKDQKCYWPRGKVLGGTSSINGMNYIRGNKEDYNDWGRISDDWKYEMIKPYFYNTDVTANKPENSKSDEKNSKTESFLHIEHDNVIHPIEKILLDANQEIGSPILANFDGEEQIGVSTVSTATKNGERQSTFNAFIKPMKGNKNLTVITNVYVDRIIFENTKAKKVVFHIQIYPSKSYEVKTGKEIILSAGTINSAQILLKSGIGPEYVLKEKPDITTIANLAVGENLQDHIFAPVMFKVKSNDDSNSLLNIFKNFYDYVSERKGPLGRMSPQRVISFINTTDSKSNVPDIQNHFIVLYPNQSNIVDIFIQHKYSDQFYKSFNDLNKDHIIIIVYVTLLQPKSRGTIKLGDNNQPLIDANYLDNEDDIDTIIKGMKHAIKLEHTNSFKNANLKLHWIEIDACKDINKTTDDYLKCITKHLTGTLYHAVGTNKMGKQDDATAVVDERLKVKNVANLRVIDASVMPSIVRGNTMAATMMIAEKGVRFLKEDWSQ